MINPSNSTPGTRLTNNATTLRPPVRPVTTTPTMVRRPNNPAPTTPNAPTTQAGKVKIDLMVVYTPGAADQHKGHDGIKSSIRAAVARLNAALRTSGIKAQVRLVHMQQINYTTTGRCGKDLSNLSRSYNPLGTRVARLRNLYNADLVTMVFKRSSHRAAGMAYTLTRPRRSPSSGFNLVSATALGDYVLAHEIGHNLGCCHEMSHYSNSTPPRGAFHGSYGYRFHANVEHHGKTTYRQFRTIMAYPPGARTGRFSNPAITYQGVRTGTDEANNAYTINRTAAIVASNRSAISVRP